MSKTSPPVEDQLTGLRTVIHAALAELRDDHFGAAEKMLEAALTIGARSTPPRRSPLLVCDDFPEFRCCEGCHADWELWDGPAPTGAGGHTELNPHLDEIHRAIEFLPHLLWVPKTRQFAAVCCWCSSELEAQGRALRLRIKELDWEPE